MSQTSDIYEYLKNGGSITGLDCVNKFGCLYLPRRIKDVERDYNIKIERKWEEQDGKRFLRYFLNEFKLF